MAAHGAAATSCRQMALQTGGASLASAAAAQAGSAVVAAKRSVALEKRKREAASGDAEVHAGGLAALGA